MTTNTQFAPAERAPSEVVHRQHNYFRHNQMMNAISDAVPNGLTILNQQRQIVYANRTMLNMLHEPPRQSPIGLRPGEALNCAHAYETGGGCGTTEFCATCGAVRSILQAQQGHRDEQECRILYNRNGAVDALDLRVWSTPFDYDGERFTLFAVTDISDEKRRQILERLFFHDIANTAGAIQGLVQLIDMHKNLVELTEMGIGDLLAQASHQLVDEIVAQRELIAAENGELEPHYTLVSALDILEECISLYRKHGVAEDRSLQIAPQATAVMLETDPALLRRVLGNLLKNALEASAMGDTVTAGCDQIGQFVRFWVHNPTFMPRQVQLQIFQRSFSTKGNGRGLGTYSIKLLSERYLNGQVSFTSSRDKGTVFVAIYPLQVKASSL